MGALDYLFVFPIVYVRSACMGALDYLFVFSIVYVRTACMRTFVYLCVFLIVYVRIVCICEVMRRLSGSMRNLSLMTCFVRPSLLAWMVMMMMMMLRGDDYYCILRVNKAI